MLLSLVRHLNGKNKETALFSSILSEEELDRLADECLNADHHALEREKKKVAALRLSALGVRRCKAERHREGERQGEKMFDKYTARSRLRLIIIKNKKKRKCKEEEEGTAAAAADEEIFHRICTN